MDLVHIILWLLGGMFILLVMEPEEGSNGMGLLMLALLWPTATVWFALQELFLPDDED